MTRLHTQHRILKPKVETIFGITVQRPFTAQIWRRKKGRASYQTSKVIHKRKCACGYPLKKEFNMCPKCGKQASTNAVKTHLVWSNWKTIKVKQVRSRKQAIKVAKRWYDGTPMGKQANKEAEEREQKRPLKVSFD